MALFVENATKLAMARDEARKAAAEAIREGLKAVAEMRTRAEAAEARATAAEAQVARMRALEPVAWRYWLPNAGEWAFSEDKDEIDQLRDEFPYFEIDALYALTQEPHDAK